MAYFLVLINKRIWDSVIPGWVEQGDLHADPLGNLRISNNALSVWDIDNEQSNLDLVLVALAANRQRIDKVEYGLFDQEIVSRLGIKVSDDNAQLAVPKANSFHKNLVELSVASLASLVNEMFKHLESYFKLEDEAKQLILAMARKQELVLENVKEPSMRNEITELLAE